MVKHALSSARVRLNHFVACYATRIIPLIVAAALYITLVFIFPVPPRVTDAFHNISLIFSGLLVIYFSLIFSRRGWIWNFISVFLVCVLFSLPLIYRWQTGLYHGNIFGGLLPWSDASDYYIDAQQLMLGHRFTQVSSKRPIFPGFLAVLLSVTNHNLQISVLLLVLLTAVSCYLLAREIQSTHGPIAAAFSLVFLYLFFLRFTGQTMTESLGISLGALGLAGIWQGARNKRAYLVLVGLFILSVALNVRAGAFFVLPAVVLWGGFYFQGSRWISLSFIAKGLLVVGFAFLLNAGLVKTLGLENGAAFSNYAQTFYGLASGNKGWEQIYKDHPGIAEKDIWGVAFQKIKNNPDQLVTGIVGTYHDYISYDLGAFSFPYFFEDTDRRNFNTLMWILSVSGLFSIFFHRDRLRDALFLFGYLGVLLSVSLVPPYDGDLMRVYAATMPFIALLNGIGLAFPFSFLWPEKQTVNGVAGPASNDRSRMLLTWLGFGLIGICAAGPVLVLLTGSPKGLTEPLACGKKQKDIEVNVFPGAYFILVPDSVIANSYLPYIRISDFRRSIQDQPSLSPELGKELLKIDSNQMVISAVNRADYYSKKGSAQNVILITDPILPKSGPLKICGDPTQNLWLQRYGFFYGSAAQSTPVIPTGLYYESRTLNRPVGMLYAAIAAFAFLFAGYQSFRSYVSLRRSA